MSAFDLIVQRHKAPLLNFIYRYLNNHDSAEDITQEVFIRIYKNVNNYHPDIAGFRTWMYKIATNLCKNEIRNVDRRSKVLVPSSTNRNEENEKLEDIQDPSPGPDIQLEDKELQEALSMAISNLPEKFRIVLILRDIEGMSYDEIAKIINKPEGTVKSRLNRARLMLKDRLKTED
jgi:RNA polymerase sigma-70 factor (ECF subfamily)